MPRGYPEGDAVQVVWGETLMERRQVLTVLAEVEDANDGSFRGWQKIDVTHVRGGISLRIDDRRYWMDAENAEAIVEALNEGDVT